MGKDNRANCYSPEARAVRMVFFNQGGYESQSAAIIVRSGQN